MLKSWSASNAGAVFAGLLICTGASDTPCAISSNWIRRQYSDPSRCCRCMSPSPADSMGLHRPDRRRCGRRSPSRRVDRGLGAINHIPAVGAAAAHSPSTRTLLYHRHSTPDMPPSSSLPRSMHRTVYLWLPGRQGNLTRVLAVHHLDGHVQPAIPLTARLIGSVIIRTCARGHDGYRVRALLLEVRALTLAIKLGVNASSPLVGRCRRTSRQHPQRCSRSCLQ